MFGLMSISATRRAIVRQALSITASTLPFGVAFGVACSDAGLGWPGALVFCTLVFTGGTQFAAVGVLADGGSAYAAIAAGLLLSFRSLLYGVVMAPTLAGPRWRRALESHLMIDETVAVASAQTAHADRRFGYLTMGGMLFVFWALSGVLGAVLFAGAGDVVLRYGIDAAVPASFLALLWPRLALAAQRRVALAGAAIAAVAMPLVPAGLPIVARRAGRGRRVASPAASGRGRCPWRRRGVPMSTWLVVALALAAGTYAFKAAGPLLLGDRPLPQAVDRVATLAPPALLAALVVVSALGGAGVLADAVARLLGLVAAGLCLWRGRGFVVVVAVAVGVTAAVRLL